MTKDDTPGALLRAPVAVFLAWLIPGLGHVYLGHRTRGIILLVALTLTFWSGVAIGGAKTVNPDRPPIGTSAPESPTGRAQPGSAAVTRTKSWWFFGQVLIGGYAVGGLTLSAFSSDYNTSGAPRYLAWPSGDLANVYTGVAGLLNLLVILDAMARADRSGRWDSSRPAGPRSGSGRR
jgi:hypothetical protein